jgi:hypothetical protein
MSATPATLTPATLTPASIAARGAIVATPAALATLSDIMRDYDAAAAKGASASQYLERAALASFRDSAASLASSLDGREVLPRNLKGAAQAIVWRAATGHPVPVPAADRSAAERALGDYLSRFATVATNAGFGIASLTTPADVRRHAKDISAAAKESKDSEATRARNALAARYSRAREAMTDAERDAHILVRDYYAAGNSRAEFAPLYAAGIIAAAEGIASTSGPSF